MKIQIRHRTDSGIDENITPPNIHDSKRDRDYTGGRVEIDETDSGEMYELVARAIRGELHGHSIAFHPGDSIHILQIEE